MLGAGLSSQPAQSTRFRALPHSSWSHNVYIGMPLLLPILLLLSACFPTLHNARVEPGLRVDAGLTLLTDQPR